MEAFNYYFPTPEGIWQGRTSDASEYLHEKVQLLNLKSHKDLKKYAGRTVAFLGYASDTGVSRNQGRVGAKEGPVTIKSALGKMPNHLNSEKELLDLGSFSDPDGNMEALQQAFAMGISRLLNAKIVPLALGGGHEMAYAHYLGLRQALGKDFKLGIINFDAHFDLRKPRPKPNSGTPFYQIAMDSKTMGIPYRYLCLGVRKDANAPELWDTAAKYGVNYLENLRFQQLTIAELTETIENFIDPLDGVYLSIDLDGFSSAYAPGVSAPSPMGYSPAQVLKALNILLRSGKVISLDIAEMNPKYDLDGHTAKLAASLSHHIIHQLL